MLRPIVLRLLFPVWLVVTFVSVSTANAEPRVALVIANSAYVGSLDKLANPVNDGRLIAGTLKKLGFTVTLVTDADQRKMKRAISDFGEAVIAAGPTTSALFYYAGHGLQVNGHNYLVPVNADIQREGDVDLEAVSAEAVLSQMEYATPRTRIIILDACRNNPLSRGFRSATRGLARMDAPNGSYVAYSTAPGEVAADGSGKNSPFAAALAQEVVKPGQGIEEAFRKVRVQVSKATGGQQTPWDSSSLMDSFFFAGDKAQVAAAAPATPAPAPATTPLPVVTDVGQNALEMSFWESIKNSNDAGDYAAYLAQYPNGNYARLAEARLQSLKEKAGQRSAAAPAPSAPATVPPEVPPLPIQPEATTPPAAAPETDVAALETPAPSDVSSQSTGGLAVSSQVGAALRSYLAANKINGVVGFFFVSQDGQGHGAVTCVKGPSARSGIKPCPLKQGSTYSELPDVAGIRKASEKDCTKRAGSGCLLLYSGNEQKAAYHVVEDGGNSIDISDAEAVVPETTAPVAPEAPAAVAAVVPDSAEPDFESPLADGTIVLSPKIATQLGTYLSAVKRTGTTGFFYVTPDGRQAGDFACNVEGIGGLPACPVKLAGAWADPKPDGSKVKKLARDACMSGASAECVMLYSGETQRATYKIFQ